jgi:CRP/FNR family transcriptional regulator
MASVAAWSIWTGKQQPRMNDGGPTIVVARPPPGGLSVVAPMVATPPIVSPALPSKTKCTDCEARHASVCDAVPATELARLSAAAVVATIPPGQRFIVEGNRAEDFFTLTAGTAKLLKTLPDGRQHITSFAGTGDFLGLAVGNSYAYSAEAVDAVRLCRFSRPKLRRLIADFPRMEARLLEITRHELVLAQEQMLLLGCKTARERLSSFLLQRAGAAGRGRAGGPVHVPLPMTRGDIGDYLGLRIETVCRMLTQLRQDGVIATTHVPPAIAIRDVAALERLAARG